MILGHEDLTLEEATRIFTKDYLAFVSRIFKVNVRIPKQTILKRPEVHGGICTMTGYKMHFVSSQLKSGYRLTERLFASYELQGLAWISNVI